MARWTVADLPPLDNRTVVITGAGGLGFEAALAMAGKGAEVVLAGRSIAKGEAALADIRARIPAARVRFETLDLASLASVEAFADRLAGEGAPIDVLMNNAGVMAPPRRGVTADDFELQLGTNHLGHFALTGRLLPLLQRGRNPRVVAVSSIAHRNGKIAFDDLQSERRYQPWAAYSQSKLANLMFAYEFQRRSDAGGWGIAGLAAHPGVARTELIANGPGGGGAMGVMNLLSGVFFQSAAQGALPQLYAAAAPEAKPGGFYGPDGFGEARGYPKPAKPAPQALDQAVAARLWGVSEALTGVRFAG